MVTMGGESDAAKDVEVLAAALPRILIADGTAGLLAAAWVDRLREDRAAGRVGCPRFPFSKAVADALFASRRARQLERGLETIAEALERQASGLQSAAATRPAGPGGRRISRLLVIAEDGSARFEREAARLRARHADRLELIGLEADERALGEAVYGAGRRARALLLAHKEAVVRVLDAIGADLGAQSADGAD